MSEDVHKSVCKLKQIADELLEDKQKLDKLKTEEVLNENIQKLSNCILKYMNLIEANDVYKNKIYEDMDNVFVGKINLEDKTCLLVNYLVNIDRYNYILASGYNCETKETKYYSRLKVLSKELFDDYLQKYSLYDIYNSCAKYETYKEYKKNEYEHYCKKGFNEWKKNYKLIMDTYKFNIFDELTETSKDQFDVIKDVCIKHKLKLFVMTKEDQVKLLKLLVEKLYYLLKNKKDNIASEIKSLNV